MSSRPRAVEPGLRQRKKQQTRYLIADTAWRLFIERGFDPVTVAFLSAFGRFLLGMLEARGLLASTDKETGNRLVAVSRVITESPALLAREQQIFDRYTASLAALISKETGAAEGAVEPWVAANALMGVHRGLLDYTRRRVLAGVRNPRLGREVRRQGEHALALLRQGLGHYGAKSVRSRGV